MSGGELQALRGDDELSQAMRLGRAFYGWHEVGFGDFFIYFFSRSHALLCGATQAALTFEPTYKYDVGTDRYDTSEKSRCPAWYDALFYSLLKNQK